MQNKSNVNTILLVIIIILLAVGLFYIISNNSKQKNDDLKQYPLPEIPTPTPKTTSTPNPTPKPCNITSGTNLEAKYNNLRCQYSLKYETFYSAVNAFKIATDSHMEVEKIDFYVPGKIPREDGNPYFIGRGTVNVSTNDCVVGYMNLVTGILESHHDVCVIYN